MDTPPKRKPGRPKKLGKTEQVSVRFSSKLLTDYENTWKKYIERIEQESSVDPIVLDIVKKFTRADVLREVFDWAFHRWDSFLLESKDGLEYANVELLLAAISVDTTLKIKNKTDLSNEDWTFREIQLRKILDGISRKMGFTSDQEYSFWKKGFECLLAERIKSFENLQIPFEIEQESQFHEECLKDETLRSIAIGIGKKFPIKPFLETENEQSNIG